MTDHATRWKVLPDIDSPCADITFAYGGPNALSITMHFSRVVSQPDRDLVIWFKDATALRWSTDPTVLAERFEALPKCIAEPWSSCTFPLIKVEHSSWLREHAAFDPTATLGRAHFLLVSINDVCELLAVPVTAMWVKA